MPRRYPNEIRRQVVELARSGTKVAQLRVCYRTRGFPSNVTSTASG